MVTAAEGTENNIKVTYPLLFIQYIILVSQGSQFNIRSPQEVQGTSVVKYANHKVSLGWKG